MIKSTISLLIFFSIHIYGIAQSNIEFIPLNTIAPSADMSDLAQLDSFFENKIVIGIGEATHGTSEFVTMRHRLFRYLVENKGFNVFFLEADFSACQQINRYINGRYDNSKKALLETGLWPWRTEEMLSMIEWMRKHNESAEQKIQFVGCDMQFIKDDKKELARLLKKTSEKEMVDSIFMNMENFFNDSIDVKSRFDKWHVLRKNIKLNTERERKEFDMVDKTILQWFGYHLSKKTTKYNIRDSCMANNIIHYLALSPGSKGIYFAHNGHVAKAVHEYQGTETKVAGRYLHEAMQDEYLCIGQTFNIGTFNARTYIKKRYVLKPNTLKAAKNKSLANLLSSLNTPLLFCAMDNIQTQDKLKFTNIGAVYGKMQNGYKVKRYRNLKEGRYDCFIYMEKTTATKLIERPKKTN